MEKKVILLDADIREPLYESPINNIKLIREIGMEAFLEKQRSEWTCKDCGRKYGGAK